MDRQLIETTYEMRKLDTSEKIESFDCGDTDLNDFILNESFLYREALLAVSYVLENKVNQRSVAYFSLANDRISLSDFENKTEFNRFRKHRFVNEKRLKSYPAAKICRLGVDLSWFSLISMFIAEQIFHQRIDDCGYWPDNPCDTPVKGNKAPA